MVTSFRLVIGLVTSGLIAFAQSEVGGASLNGRLLDPSGATVAQAKITAVNTNTGFSRLTESTEGGNYNFVRLPVGGYSISVEKADFKQFKKSGIQLTVGAVLTRVVRTSRSLRRG